MTEASDIWALGVIVVEMITSVYPYIGRTLVETVQNIKTGRFKPIPDYDSLKCPTAEELLDSNMISLVAKIEAKKKRKRKNEIDLIIKTGLTFRHNFLENPRRPEPLDGTEEQKQEIIKNQENSCQLITLNLEGNVDAYIRKIIIKSGVIDTDSISTNNEEFMTEQKQKDFEMKHLDFQKEIELVLMKKEERDKKAKDKTLKIQQEQKSKEAEKMN
ncbi:MAG: hypothetical protein EZS28_004584 [Streblomastix strix]|uniref:Protein kinase domain-containing protein n=1 Tax=Streblomastix strix TaxID=222440 RepID=A0A5J4WZV6_9EUKA|nr:MAG: hypothetical protein EZS28_004584 [Streblomastix strix]